MADQAPQFLSAPQIPEPRGPVLSSRTAQPPVGGNGHAPDPTLVAPAAGQLLTRPGIPAPHGAVVAPREDPPAIGGPGRPPSLRSVPHQPAILLPAVQVQEPDCPVGARR